MFPQIFGKYVLERELAAGGMAKVYLATLRGAVGFEKRLVVKQIRPELASDLAFVRRFVEEAKVAVELSHANIVPVYELGVEQGVYYIAMELCGGLTLSEVLAASGTLSAEEGAYLGSEICRALDYAHRRASIVHRDVTPRNVLIDEEGAVRLIDFGIAAPVAITRGDRSEVFGSPGHMPPEQLAGGPLTPAADVFAVAALLVEVWTGRPPFRRASARESEQALSAPVPRVDSNEPALSPLAEHVARALSLDPEQRPARAELFARPLRDFLRSVDSVDVARRLGERVRRTQRRSRSPDASNVTPAPSSAAASAPPSQPFTTGLPTQTFAAREEVVEWTRRLESQPPEPEPADSPSVVELASPGGSAGDAPERAATPRRGALLRTVAVASALALVMVAALELVRSREAEPAQSASVPARAAPPTGSFAASPAPRESVALPAPASLAATPARPVASARAAVNASLRLTADPPAHVSINGSGVSRSFETPVRDLKLPAGSYSVTFRSAIYSAPLNTRVLLTGGAQRSVHADFRDAEPRVTVR